MSRGHIEEGVRRLRRAERAEMIRRLALQAVVNVVTLSASLAFAGTLLGLLFRDACR